LDGSRVSDESIHDMKD